MKNKPLVSIIINCYNGEFFLKRCIQSVLNQTYKNWEIIFWDNQSNDNSKKLYKTFKDKRLKYYLAKKFTNLYAARNLALKKARGKIFMFIDIDDEWFSNKIEEQLKIFNKKKVDIVCSNYLRVKNFFFKFKKKQNHNNYDHYLNLDENLKNYLVGWSTVAIRKKIFNLKKKNFNEKLFMISDYDFIMSKSINKNIYYINKPLVLYNEHKNQASRKFFFEQIKQFMIWYNKIKKKKDFVEKKNFIFLHKRYKFLKSLEYIKKSNNFLEVLKQIKKFKDFKSKIKILLYYFLPGIYISYYTST